MAHEVLDTLRVLRNDTKAKTILARNLIRLMDRPGVEPISSRQLAKRAPGLTYRTILRIRNAEVNPTLDHIEAIAKAFVLAPWQLLVPNFDAVDPPHLAFTQAEKDAYEKMQAALDEFRALQAGQNPKPDRK